MGGATSRFAETNWETADGGLKDPSQTIDGMAPIREHSILALKKSSLVNQREFVIRDDAGDLLYTSKAMEGTTKWFNLFDANGNKIFSIQTDSLRNEWRIYSLAPNWEGQAADAEAKASMLDVEEGNESLYRRARIDITWNKYHGEVHFFGPSEDDPCGVMEKIAVLRCEEISSITAQFQSYSPKDVLLDNALHPPLAGWWVWEHTKRSHQLKMHLAKGTDAALHCIVAITCNMVNVEKQTEKIQ